jgi:hypothetical protein
MTQQTTTMTITDSRSQAFFSDVAPVAAGFRAAAEAPAAAISRKRAWAGRIVSAVPVLFLAFDSMGKLLQLEPVVEGTKQLGYASGAVLKIGLVQLACLLAYLVRRTSVLGAVLLTGHLGGAIATHVRVDNPLFTHVLFPIYVAVLLWGGLYLRDHRLAGLLSSGRRR